MRLQQSVLTTEPSLRPKSTIFEAKCVEVEWKAHEELPFFGFS